MKIMHCCLSCFYIDGFSYQENMLVRQAVKDGHDTVVVASTEVLNQDGQFAYLDAGRYEGTDGATVIRLPYKNVLPHMLMKKIRAYSGFKKILLDEKPDVILFHGLCAWEMLTLLWYKKHNPKVRLFVDSHEDWYNSAMSFISRNILHRLFYRPIIRKAAPHFEEILCCSLESMDFVNSIYGLNRSLLEYYPLGGEVPEPDQYTRLRNQVRGNYKLDDKLVFIQSGKMDSSKKLLESIYAFSALDFQQSIFLIAGTIHPSILEKANSIIESDSRIHYLGWQSSEDLYALYCAADVYVQPGTQSASLQMALCCSCLPIVANYASHEPFVSGNGWLVNNDLELRSAFSEAVNAYEAGVLDEKSNSSLRIAKNLLDYKKLSSKLY